MNVPWTGIVNGSLWTLPYEVEMYAILALVLGFVSHLVKRFKYANFRNVSLLLAVASLTLYLTN